MDLRTFNNLADAFAARAAEQPQALAVTLGDRSASYGDLDRMATNVACALQARGVQRGDLVALVCDRTIELIAAMLGVTRVGAAYLPIDPRYPQARITQTLEDARPRIVFADDGNVAADALLLSEAVAFHGETRAWPERSREDLAYVIYTSGSTGKPKGVMVSEGNVLRLFTATEPWYSFHASDVWTMFHSPSFDFSVWEIWGALLYGGRLVLVPFETCRDPEAVCALIEREGVTVFNQSPAAFNLLMQAEARKPEMVRSLRYVIFGGEALNLRSLAPWFARHGDAQPQLINMYGITETTVHVMYRRVYAGDAANENDSLIGVAIPDLELHLLDENLQPTTEGELFVGGAGVAHGYLNLPELTAQRFIANPFGEGKLYRSGDLARRREDGELAYLGRGDRQVKLRGYRIELGEIEAVLLKHPQVKQVVADVAAGSSLLCAYFVGEAEPATLASFATQHLPEHMRPNRFIAIDAVPLTINGKIDRKALALLGEQKPAAATHHTSLSSAETKIAFAWRNVLALDATPHPEQNFFEAGGTSLLLHKLRTELEHTLAQPISILTLFQFPSIRSLATALEAKPQTQAPSTPSRTGFRPIRLPGKVTQS
ncbi:amino acid adenylation domain-containing protein [Granulicella cerasi]|uniref:Amino acid adenylation domain-containing protein n=1 Tax=Granulicella cerasi TaxID=741063 RepID=A0ABW1ZCC8_9BACT|nr:amino acid adenylation domain-containing protein [Granulicella cerasi]